MNRRGVLWMLGLAPLASVAAMAAASTAPVETVIGIDAGGADDAVAVAAYRISPADLQIIAARRFGPDEIAHWFRIPPEIILENIR